MLNQEKLSQAKPEITESRAGQRRISSLVVACASLTMLLCIGLSGLRFHFSYFDLDTVSYLFEAKLLAQGRLAAGAPPDQGFSPSPHINVDRSLWYSKYPPGNALALAVGVLTGTPWLIPVLATGGALLLLYGVLLETYGRKVARVGIVLGMFSPATVVLGAVWFSEAVSRFCLGLFLYCLVIAFKKRNWKYAVAAGFAVGYAFDTRPLTAATMGLVAGSLFVIHSWATTRQEQRIRILGALVMGCVAAASLTFVWNDELTGNPLRPTFNDVQPYDKLGFGPRGNQYTATPTPANFTAPNAARRVVLRSLPAMLQSALGIGFYDFRLYDWLSKGPMATRLRALGELAGFLVPALLVGLSFRTGEYRFFNALFASIVVANLLAYSFYFFDGSGFGFTPLHTRYQTETIMFGFLPLVARGFVALRERVSFGSMSRKLALALVVVLLSLNYVQYWRRIIPSLQSRSLTEMETALQQVHSQSAVIFYTGTLDVPLGDYPFTTLDKARIVTFRLTKNPPWGLEEDDPVDAYRRYFQGRDAFLFRDDKLIRLNMPVATREKL